MYWMKFMVLTLFIVGPFQTYAYEFSYDQIIERSNRLLKDLIAAKPITGCEDEAAKIVIERIKELELPYQVILSGDAPASKPVPMTDELGLCLDGRQPSTVERPNVIIRLKATKNPGKLKAFMVMAHFDVVSAVGQKWSKGIKPHEMEEKDGYIYGRGTNDMLSYLATSLEIFGEIKKSGLPLERDLILMINSDEEKMGVNGVGWLVKNRPEIFQNIEIAISEGGSVVTDDEQNPLFIGYETAQKRYQDFKISAQGETGHSSTPSKIQAVKLLTEALAIIQKLEATPRLTPLIRTYFQERAKVETMTELKSILTKIGSSSSEDEKNLTKKYGDDLKVLEKKYPVVHALLKRTCTNTVLDAGSASAKNAQPQYATAYVNCRLMPDENVDDLYAIFQKEINWKAGDSESDSKVQIALDIDNRSNHADGSPIRGIFPETLAKYASEYFRGIPTIPSMLTAATDLRFLRKLGIDAYGFSPVFISDSDKKRAHGIDERIYAKNLTYGAEVFTNVILDITAPSTRKPASGKKAFPGKISKKFKNAFGDSHSIQNGCHH